MIKKKSVYRCKKVYTSKEKILFLSLPSKLYKDVCPQNYQEEQDLLNRIHVLSNDFELVPYVVVNSLGKAVCRCAVTYYPDDEVAYVGFFEACDNLDAVRVLFDTVEKDVLKKGRNKIVGPVNASIFIGYRFKVDNFNRIYTGEPYNKPYYKELWEQCGFQVSDTYVSNFLRKVTENDNDEFLEKIYNRYKRKGYEFISPSAFTFKKRLKDIYALMMNLYSGFSGYKIITEKQFMKMFSYLKHILNYDMVKLVYHKDKLQAFCVAVPNYRELSIGDTSVSDVIKMMKTKRKPDEYVILYVGADQSSPGLGGALMHLIKNLLYENQCTSVGALVKEGNVSGEYFDFLYTDKTHYELFEKVLEK